ncbi:phosphoesterase [Halteromyces radiatus]|uniref:phosphoesterase n=1 Tax=Halteromyces radiatus TaxID=101107 RepID=UPI002220F33D|nr:phosphoesterase [Halteromyces radiatus]KAI8076353.1 phosphoesterase [Halteromyces radiatus]
MVLLGTISLFCIAATALASPVHSGNNNNNWKNNIKNVVVLVQENRSFDTFAGGLTYSKDINGLLHHKYCNPANVTDAHSTQVCADKLTSAHDVDADDPNHSMSGINLQLYGTTDPNEALIKSGKLKANMQGFITEQERTYGTTNLTRVSDVINYYTVNHIPVFSSMAENFVLFDRWFCDVSGPTNPNRAYITSGTSNGHGSNDKSFDYGGLPQKSIFQQLSEKNITWINYSNSTTSPKGYMTPEDKGYTGFNPDSVFYNWTVASGAAKTNVKHFEQFITDAKNGDLPAFSYINPECCSFDSFHPPSPIDLGEKFLKIVYEALRGSPQWNQTLFILTFDEHGGFADHVPPPVNVPAGDSKTYVEKNHTFDFTRLGVRVPTILMSPWVNKGVVEHKGSNNGGEYSHSSVLGFLAKLWDLDNLTPRTAWSSTFEHLFIDKPRTDTPAKLPEPVVFA